MTTLAEIEEAASVLLPEEKQKLVLVLLSQLRQPNIPRPDPCLFFPAEIAQWIADDEAGLDPAELEIEFAEIMKFTREIFGGEVRIEVFPDPEILGLTHISFCAKTIIEPVVTLAKRREWHERLDAAMPVYDRRLGLCLEHQE